MDEKIQRTIDRLQNEIRDCGLRIENLEQQSFQLKIEAKLQIYREIGMIRRRREDAERKLERLRATLATAA